VELKKIRPKERPGWHRTKPELTKPGALTLCEAPQQCAQSQEEKLTEFHPQQLKTLPLQQRYVATNSLEFSRGSES
jgi:hypothetical protein